MKADEMKLILGVSAEAFKEALERLDRLICAIPGHNSFLLRGPWYADYEEVE